MKFLLALFVFVFLLSALGLIVASILKKQLKLFGTGMALILLSAILGFFFFLNHAAEIRQLDTKNLTSLECIRLVIDEIQHPYDPCQNELFDGPVYHTEKKKLRYLFYDDFIILFSPDMNVNVLPLTQIELSEYFFSLSNAAYAIRDQVIGQKPAEGNFWMIQLTDISKSDSNVMFNFVIGEGKTNLSCPHYFKITQKAAVSIAGDVYQKTGEELVHKGVIQNTENESLTPENNYGVNRLDFMD